MFRLTREIVRAKRKLAKPKIKTSSVVRLRADAHRNVMALLNAAKAVFAISGVEAPVRDIADRAGVGIGTFYRHFPQRSDLISAVFRHEIDDCAGAAPVLAAKYSPGNALAKWLQRYAAFIETKRGLAAALHSGNPAFEHLPAYFDQHLRPALRILLEAAVTAGEVRNDVEAEDLLHAVASLCMPAKDDGRARRMVALLIDGLRYDKSETLKVPLDRRRHLSLAIPKRGRSFE